MSCISVHYNRSTSNHLRESSSHHHSIPESTPSGNPPPPNQPPPISDLRVAPHPATHLGPRLLSIRTPTRSPRGCPCSSVSLIHGLGSAVLINALVRGPRHGGHSGLLRPRGALVVFFSSGHPLSPRYIEANRAHLWD